MFVLTRLFCAVAWCMYQYHRQGLCGAGGGVLGAQRLVKGSHVAWVVKCGHDDVVDVVCHDITHDVVEKFRWKYES